MTNQLPAYLQNRQSKAVAQTLQANLGAGSPPYLSIEGNRFRLIDAVGNEQPVPTYDPQIGPYIDINIVDVNNHISKIYFDPNTPYDPKATDRMPPLCWSDNGVGPSRNASEPQSPTCAACPNDAWGSATSKVTGKGIKACSDLQKIAFTTAGHKTVFLMRIPPNSLVEMRAYVGKFASGEVGDITDVVTRVSFKPGIQGTLQFQAVSYIDEATHMLREAIAAAKSSDAIVGRLDTPHPGLAALPAPTMLADLPNDRKVTVESHGGPAPGAQTGVAPFPTGAATPFQPTTASIAPNAGAVSSQTAATTPAPSATDAAPTTTSPSRRRGRPPAQPAQQAAPVQAATIQAPFPTNAPAPQAGPAATSFPAAAAPPGNSFGIQPGVAPNAEIAATLNQLFPR